jgi:23S rRNA (uracil1939-C5)-methyltransferase
LHGPRPSSTLRGFAKPTMNPEDTDIPSDDAAAQAPENGSVELQIDSLSYGRAALGRTADGKVVFVEGAAPGDRVEAVIDRDQGTYALAHVGRVLVPGAARVEAPCPLVERCGGCPWQHIDYSEQLLAKRKSVIDALERIAGIENPPVEPVIASPDQLDYRNRLKLRFDGRNIGFYSSRSHTLVPIDNCIVAEPIVREAIEPARALAESLSTRVLRIEIASRGKLGGVVLALNGKGRLRRADTHRVRDMLAAPGHPVRGVVMWGKGWRRTWGDTRRRHSAAGHPSVETTGTAFGQVNTGANHALVETVADAAALDGKQRVLDLYAGAGNFSLALARDARRIVAVESDRDAVEAARRSVEHHRLGNVMFFESRVENFLESSDGPPMSRPDVVIVNPPRSGIGGAAASIARLGARRIVYVSCDPTTLARDLRVMIDEGYRLRKATPVDLFPHTFHVETVCDVVLT